MSIVNRISVAALVALAPAWLGARGASQAQRSQLQAQLTQAQLEIHVYRLKHVDAIWLAPMLQQLAVVESGRRPDVPGVVDSVLAVKDTITQRADAGASRTVTSPVPVAVPPVAASAGTWHLVRVVAETNSNSLLVRATPSDWALVQQIIQRIDQ